MTINERHSYDCISLRSKFAGHFEAIVKGRRSLTSCLTCLKIRTKGPSRIVIIVERSRSFPRRIPIVFLHLIFFVSFFLSIHSNMSNDDRTIYVSTIGPIVAGVGCRSLEDTSFGISVPVEAPVPSCRVF